MSDSKLEELEWPWLTVPDENRAKIWAGRPDQKKSLRGLLARWRRRPKSEINVIWADFGQGKTHTLMHLDGEIESTENWLAHYVQLPPLTSGSPFVGFYKQLMLEFPLEAIAAMVFERFRRQPNQLFDYGRSLDRSIVQLLWMIHTKSHGYDVAVRWMRGDRVPASALRRLSISDRALNVPASPTRPADCQNVLDALISIYVDFSKSRSSQFILLIDEFQRVGELGPKKLVEFCDSLHLIYNKHSLHLQIVLAFATGAPEMIDLILTPDLRSREDSRTGFPALSLNEAIQYVEELIAIYGYRSDSSAYIGPYEREGLKEVLRSVSKVTELTPRRINLIFDRLSNDYLDDNEIESLNDDLKMSTQDMLAILESLDSFKKLLAEDM
jgi:hypothetical protein